MTKMIVVDLDGTLLRADKTLSARTEAALRKCRAAGVKVVYATGRGGTADALVPPALFDGRIAMNGSIARIGEEIVYHRLIPCLTARPLLLACHARGLKAASEISAWHYANFTVSDEWPEITNFTVVDFVTHDKDAEKLYAVHVTPDDARFIESRLPASLRLIMARDNFAQIMHKEVSKARAVAELARIWQINPAHITAFGDDLNDIDLLRYAGTGVAMANALDAVKAAADATCPGNEEDGVARWLEARVAGA